MAIQTIPIVCISYNSAELISDLLYSLRRFYENPIYIIDGSQEPYYKEIETVANKFSNVEFIHFDYNIHHGPGMAWAISNLNLHGRVLFLDSDICVINNGFIQSLNESLKPEMYGVGMVNNVNEGGFDVSYELGAIKYLHPACMLCNIDVMRKWPLPLKHGAPMTEAMMALHKANAADLLGHIPWLKNDFTPDSEKKYIRHDWQGTVSRTGGYHLNEWHKSAQEKAEFQRDLISLIPKNARQLVEFECGTGELARLYRGTNPSCFYTGIESKKDNLLFANIFCNNIINLNLNELTDLNLQTLQNTDCWILSNILETIQDPWALLKTIRSKITNDGCIVACIPNAQHWSLQAKLNIGDYRYTKPGPLKIDHIRFFTRATIFELFQQAGFKIEQGFPRTTEKLQNNNLKEAIKLMAIAVGADPDLALEDAMPIHYMIKAIPVDS